MRRPSLLGVGLLVVGMVAGAWIVDRAEGQVSKGYPPSWPPRPQDIVNVRKAKAAVEDGDALRAYEVPNNQWLVLTDFRFDVENEPGSNVYPDWSMLVLGEDFGGSLTIKVGEYDSYGAGPRNLADYSYRGVDFNGNGGGMIPFSSVTGMVFRPGSKVSIRYTNPYDVKGDGKTVRVSCNLTGYLVDA